MRQKTFTPFKVKEEKYSEDSLTIKKVFILLFMLLLVSPLWAQDLTTTAVPKFQELRVGLEFRPRTEFRDGYKDLRTDTSNPAFLTSQRSRLNITYDRPGFIFHTSIQDIRIWGEQNPRSTNGTIQILEAFVEPVLAKNLSVRIGRQRILYDNQRLFAENNWRQSSRAHDAVRFMYYTPQLQTDLIGAFNQSSDRTFETDYAPVGFTNYKVLMVHFLKYKLSDQLILTTINASDGYQDAGNVHKTHYRFTSGGRIEYVRNKLYLTVAGYYQYGKNASRQKISAYYYQPEIKYNPVKPLTFRLGAEVLSGDNGSKANQTFNSFVPLYGANHRFMGSMDYFTSIPGSLNNAGLVDFYLFTYYTVRKKITLRADFHSFHSQNNFVDAGKLINKYLGFENDLLLIYQANKATQIQMGFSYALPTNSLEIIKKKGNSALFQTWGFLMLTFKPELLMIKKEIAD